MEREKLLNAIIYFVKNTNRCYKLKLFKLLYFFDSDCFKKRGRTATGLRYFAWEMGPVASDLFEEMKSLKEDMSEHISVKPYPQEKSYKNASGEIINLTTSDFAYEVLAKKNFNPKVFSKNEMEDLKKIAFIYKEANASQMTEISHDANELWSKVYKKEAQNEIPFNLWLNKEGCKITREDLEEISENDEFVKDIKQSA